MARKKRDWSAIQSDAYRARLEAAGIGRKEYEAGASLKAARGHRSTPEHPKEAERDPQKYRQYKDRQHAQYIQAITKSGVQLLKLNARDRTTVARHWNAVHQWMRNGEGDLASFNGQTVRDKLTKKPVEFETDPMAIWRLTHARQTDIPIYPELL